MIKVLITLELEENLPQPAANILLNDERLNPFSLRLRTKKGCQSSPPFLFNIMLHVLASVLRQEKNKEGILLGKEELKLYYLHLTQCRKFKGIYKNTLRINK